MMWNGPLCLLFRPDRTSVLWFVLLSRSRGSCWLLNGSFYGCSGRERSNIAVSYGGNIGWKSGNDDPLSPTTVASDLLGAPLASAWLMLR